MTIEAVATAELEEQTTSKVASASIALLVRRVLVLITSVASALIVVRLLDPRNYGTLQAALATWTILSTACDFGFSATMSRELAQNVASHRSMIRTSNEIQTTIAMLVGLAFVGIGLAAGPATTQGTIYLVLAPSLMTAGLSAPRAYFLATYQVRVLVRIDSVTSLVALLATAAVAFAGFGAVGVAAVVSATTMASSVWVAHSAHRRVRTQPHIIQARIQLLRRVLPVGVMSVLSRIYISLDLSLLSIWVHTDQLGYYAGAAKIVNILNTLPGLVMGAALVGLAELAHDREQVGRLMERLGHWFVAMILPLFVGCALFASTLTPLALGHDYRHATHLTQILLLSGVLAIGSQLLGTLLVGVSIVRPLLIQNSLAVAVNVVGNVALDPHYGAAAAAWLTVATEAVVFVCALSTVRRQFRLVMSFKPLLAPGAALAAASAIGVAAPGDAAIRMGLFSATYLGLVWALRAWPIEFALPGPAGRLLRRP